MWCGIACATCGRMYLDFIAIETFAVGQIAKVIDTYTGLLPHVMILCLIRAIAEHYSFAPETNFMQSIKRFTFSISFVSRIMYIIYYVNSPKLIIIKHFYN